MFKRMAITLAVLPSVAGAQTSTTDCQRDYFGNVHCTTNGGPAIQPVQPIDYGALLRSGQQMVPDYAEQARKAEQLRLLQQQQRAQEQALASAQAERDQKNEAARLIINGDCAGAERYALSAGNIALAKEVRDYCGK